MPDSQMCNKRRTMDLLKPNSANSSPLTPITFLERAATIYGDCPSVVYNQKAYTWTQTHQRCLRLASSLYSMGISRGHVVSVVAPNIPSMYEMHFGIPMCGAILNTINTRLNHRTVSVILRHAESKVVFVDLQFRSLVEQAIESMERPPLLVIIDDDRDGSSSLGGELLTYEKLIQRGDPGFEWVRPESEWSPMVLNYTSGTTASPKGVVHCHRGIHAITVDSLIEVAVPKQPVYLWTLPMFHANGWSFPWGMAAVGGTNVCLRKFDAAAVYAAIERHRVTHMCGAPVVLNMLANAPESARRPLPHAVHITTGGAPPPATVLLRTESLGFVVTHGYGLTETGGIVISCAWKNKWNRLPATERARLKARQGVRTLCMTEVDVIDPATGAGVERNGSTLGELVLRGGCLMLGYLKDPEGTSKAIREGWFYTGDVGVMHPDGYVEIKDRSKDVIITGGENVSSVEVESVLYSHPAVEEGGVVARPDEFWGETPCAFVSLKEGYRDKADRRVMEKDVLGFCRERLPHYMVPKTVVFMDELPKTSTGKIQKFVLRGMAKQLGSTSLVSRI